jgi:hypothetical protein
MLITSATFKVLTSNPNPHVKLTIGHDRNDANLARLIRMPFTTLTQSGRDDIDSTNALSSPKYQRHTQQLFARILCK